MDSADVDLVACAGLADAAGDMRAFAFCSFVVVVVAAGCGGAPCERSFDCGGEFTCVDGACVLVDDGPGDEGDAGEGEGERGPPPETNPFRGCASNLSLFDPARMYVAALNVDDSPVGPVEDPSELGFGLVTSRKRFVRPSDRRILYVAPNGRDILSFRSDPHTVENGRCVASQGVPDLTIISIADGVTDFWIRPDTSELYIEDDFGVVRDETGRARLQVNLGENLLSVGQDGVGLLFVPVQLILRGDTVDEIVLDPPSTFFPLTARTNGSGFWIAAEHPTSPTELVIERWSIDPIGGLQKDGDYNVSGIPRIDFGNGPDAKFDAQGALYYFVKSTSGENHQLYRLTLDAPPQKVFDNAEAAADASAAAPRNQIGGSGLITGP